MFRYCMFTFSERMHLPVSNPEQGDVSSSLEMYVESEDPGFDSQSQKSSDTNKKNGRFNSSRR